MPTVLKCPQCEALVRVPEEMGVNSLVRCPACSEEFLLGEFQEPELPELVIMEAVPDPVPDSVPDLAAEPVEDSEASETSAFDFPVPQEEAPDADTLEETAPVGIWGQGESPPDEAEADTEADSAEEIPVPDAEEQADFSVEGKVRRRKEVNMGAFLLVNVLGGAVGLLVAYYGLCWLGYAGGLPKLPLPLLPHTMHWNGAVVDWFQSFSAEDPDDSNADDTAGNDETAAGDAVNPAEDPAQPAPQPTSKRKKRELAAGEVGPAEPEEYYTLSELDSQLQEAEAALAKDSGFSRASYRKICRLGGLLPFTESSAELPQRAEQIRSMLKRYGTGEENGNTVARLANLVLSYPEWPEPGILVAGEVRAVSEKNGLHEVALWLPFYKKVVPILSDKRIETQKGDRALVLGCVIKDPSEHIAGYDERVPLIIWNGLCAPVE